VPTSAVSERVERRVRRDFEPGTADAVLARLAALQLAGAVSDAGRERVQAAVVLGAGGRFAAFERQAALAETDWRDVLVAAALADDDWRARLDVELGPAAPT
jgi:hypothetical protein